MMRYILFAFLLHLSCHNYAQAYEGIRSILVLPPINNTSEPLATYSYLSTVSAPLAETGFYVFPVALIDSFMKENGLSTPDEMHAAPLDKIREVLGADAVLYVSIEEYGQQYQIINSVTKFRAKAVLISVADGIELWSGNVRRADSSNNSFGGSITGQLLGAVVSQVVESHSDHSHGLARDANREWFLGRHNFPRGPRLLNRKASSP